MIRKLFKKKIVKDSVLYTVANIVVQISSLVGVLFVSRYLGPTNLGIYSFVQNYIAVFMTLFAGIDMYANWYIVKQISPVQALHHYIKQKVAILIPLLTALILTSYVLLPADIARFVPLLCIPVLTSVLASSVFLLQYQNKTKVVVIGMICSALLLLVAKITAVLTVQPLIIFVAINSLDGMFLVVLAAYYIFIYDKGVSNTKDEKPLGIINLIRSSLYCIIYIVFWYIVTRADQFVIPAYFDAYTLGIYSPAVKVVEMANVLIVILQGILLPRLVHLTGGDGGRKNTHIVLALYLGIGLAAVMAIQILAPFAVSVLFGPAFTETVSVLRVYAWSIPGLFVSYFFTVIAMSKGTVKALALHSLAMAFFTVITLLYIAKFGSILAIAWVSALMYTISATTLYIMWRKKYL